MRYAIVFCSKYQKAGLQLFAYIQRIYGLYYKHKGTFFWRLYDEEFRRYRQADVNAEWHELEPKTLQAVEEMLLHQEFRAGDGKNLPKTKIRTRIKTQWLRAS